MCVSGFHGTNHCIHFQAGIPDPPELKPALAARREQERRFLEQLLDSSRLEPYKITVPINAELRKYQMVGGILFLLAFTYFPDFLFLSTLPLSLSVIFCLCFFFFVHCV